MAHAPSHTLPNGPKGGPSISLRPSQPRPDHSRAEVGCTPQVSTQMMAGEVDIQSVLLCARH
jgi:hypothetical protein